MEPRILVTCGHSVCSKCIQTLIDEAKNTQSEENSDSELVETKIACPDCGIVCKAENMNELPVNFSLLNMVKSGLSNRLNEYDSAIPSNPDTNRS